METVENQPLVSGSAVFEPLPLITGYSYERPLRDRCQTPEIPIEATEPLDVECNQNERLCSSSIHAIFEQCARSGKFAKISA